MNMFRDWDWSINGALPAAKSMHFLCEISHTVQYNLLISSGMSLICYTEPLLAIIWFLMSKVHKFLSNKSVTRCLLTQINSPDKTLLLYMLVVNASKASLFPRIYEVEAVGIGATSREFLIPYFLISSLSWDQLWFFGCTFHISN